MTRPLAVAIVSLALFACGTDPAEQPAAPGLAHVVTPGTPGTSLGTLGGLSSYAADINDAGTVVGWSHNTAGVVRPFRWTRSGGMSDLGVLEGDVSGTAIRILNSGSILGTSTSPGGTLRVVQWSASGRISQLHVRFPRETRSQVPEDFNDRGEVVGTSWGSEGHGWVWSRLTGTLDLRGEVPSCFENAVSAINASGMIVGPFCDPNNGNLHSYAWRRHRPYLDLGTIGEQPGFTTSYALSVNDVGTVGGWIDPTGNTTPLPYLWNKASGYLLLPVIPVPFTNATVYDVNDKGIAVGGGAIDEFGASGALGWPTPQTLVRLDGPGGGATLATAINNRGQTVGWEADGSGTFTALIWRISQGTPVDGVIPAAGSVRAMTGARRATAGCHDRPTSKGAMMACVLGSRE